MACLATEKEPESAACEAMIVAAVASTTIGHRLQPGSIWKNGLKPERCAADGWWMIHAPWPR